MPLRHILVADGDEVALQLLLLDTLRTTQVGSELLLVHLLFFIFNEFGLV